MTIFIVILLVWSAFNSFVAITALLASKMNDDHIQAIKEWLKVLGIIGLDKTAEFVKAQQESDDGGTKS